jgi:hypothetical protein
VVVWQHAATPPLNYNDVILLIVLTYNFSQVQDKLPEDDRMIETCRSVLSVF